MRRILALSFPLLLALLLVSRAAEWWSEKWWFAALDQSATWWTYMKWRGAAFAVAAPLWLAIVGSNLRLAWQQSLALRAPLSLLGGGMDEIPVAVSPSLRLGRSIMRTTIWVSAWLAGLAASNRFDLWLLFGQSAGDASELSYYLFRLPALDWFIGWLGLAFGLTFLGCLTIYFWLEAIETGPGVFRASESARGHLSLLGALLIIWKGLDCGRDIAGAAIVSGDSINGILGVPEQMVGIPLAQIFAWSALPVGAFVFWLGTRDNGKRAVALSALWLASATFVPMMAPAFARSLGVGNEAAQKQILGEHIASTRRAWGFASVKENEIKGNANFAETVLPAPDKPAPVALWPLEGAASDLENRLGKEPKPILRAARLHIARVEDNLELRAIATQRGALGEAPARQWQANADQVGTLKWQASQSLDSISLSEATLAPETNARRLGAPPLPEGEKLEPLPPYRLSVQPNYAIERSSLGACLTLAWRFFDASLIKPGPPLMLHLDPVERARNLAPFINWAGAVAHPVVIESGVGPHVYWIVEGCFTARSSPDSATLPMGDAWAGVNYARQNVTAIFDGSTGESQLYLFNRSEPIARLWNRALPGLFRPIEEMHPELRAAIRPAPAYLNAMSRIYARYHPATGDEELAWAKRESEWRSILATAQSPTPGWNDALLPDATGVLRQWQIGAFAPSRGLVDAGPGVAALTGIAGVTLNGDGSWRWQQWHPTEPLPLPKIATPPGATINDEIGLQFAPPTRVGVFPTFDENGRANGFTAFRAEVQAAKGNAPPTLRVQAETTGLLSSGPLRETPLANSLVRARDLWNEILAARRQGDWSLVARLEEQLSRALNAPSPAATPTAATATPMPTATPKPN